MTLAQGGGDLEMVALRPLMELIFSELEARAKVAGVSLSLSGDCPLVRGDQTLLYRALFNLVENAIKYNRPGGRVEAALSQRGEQIQIQVADTGIGMSEEAARHAFEPFYRADRSRSQKIPGAGLGLSVVKSIVERHGGEMTLKSAEGVGATVSITL